MCVNTIFVSHVWGCFNVYGRKLNIPVINLFINERSVTELRLSNFATVWRVLLTLHNKLNLLPFMWSIIKNARIVFMSSVEWISFPFMAKVSPLSQDKFIFIFCLISPWCQCNFLSCSWKLYLVSRDKQYQKGHFGFECMGFPGSRW